MLSMCQPPTRAVRIKNTISIVLDSLLAISYEMVKEEMQN